MHEITSKPGPLRNMHNTEISFLSIHNFRIEAPLNFYPNNIRALEMFRRNSY